MWTPAQEGNTVAEAAGDGKPDAVVVVGASAGGIDALTRVVSDLPADLGAPVLVVLHIGANPSALPKILTRAGPLPAIHPEDHEPLEANRIYVAPPDCHLLVGRDEVRVVRGPTENGHRPAIDPLFRSATVSFGSRVVGVVLSGTLDDGAAGSAAIARGGGAVIVQDPKEAAYPSMPLNTIAADHPDKVLASAKIGAAVRRCLEAARSQPLEEGAMEDQILESSFAEFDLDAVKRGEAPGRRAPFACPACGGTLWEADDDVLRFRCRVGHAFAAESLADAQTNDLDTALWTALRALEERADLAKRVGNRLRNRKLEQRAERYDRMVEEAEKSGAVIRDLILSRDGRAA